MPTVEFQVRIATAAFIHGPDGNQAELRPPAFRAGMRYWFRALAGGLGVDRESLYKAEGDIFGTTNHSSAVSVRVAPNDLETTSSPLLPHHGDTGRGDERSPKGALEANQTFTIRLVSGDDRALRAAAGSLWTALALGGIGQRSRRGAGSFVIAGVTDSSGKQDPNLPATRGLSTIDSLGNAHTQGLRAALQAVQSCIKPGGSTPAWPSLGRQVGSVRIRAFTAPDEKNARAELMRGLQGFKSAAWGLPYMKRAPGEERQGWHNGRHASPVWFHLHPLADGSWALIATHLGGPGVLGANGARIAAYFQQFQWTTVSLP